VLRKSLAAGCAFAAALGVLSIARAPRGGRLVPVVVATRTLGIGADLTPATVRLARWPLALVPEGAVTSLAAVVGRRLTASLGTGEVVTGARVSGSGVLAGQPAGTVAAHVVLPDTASAAMVRPGDSVDLVGPQGVVARAVRVLRVDADERSARGGVLGGGALGGVQDPQGGLVVAMDPSAVEALARVPADALGRPALTLTVRAS
jgi:Flp pilus assembly protein CpaB